MRPLATSETDDDSYRYRSERAPLYNKGDSITCMTLTNTEAIHVYELH